MRMNYLVNGSLSYFFQMNIYLTFIYDTISFSQNTEDAYALRQEAFLLTTWLHFKLISKNEYI